MCMWKEKVCFHPLPLHPSLRKPADKLRLRAVATRTPSPYPASHLLQDASESWVSGWGCGLRTPYHKEHLPLIVVRQQEEPRDGVVRDLVIKSFPVKLEEGGVCFDRVATPVVWRARAKIIGTSKSGFSVGLNRKKALLSCFTKYMYLSHH